MARGNKEATPIQLKTKDPKKSKKLIAIRAEEEAKFNVTPNDLEYPEDLSDKAKKEWDRIVALYRDLQDPILNDLDKDALRVYCEAVVTYKENMAVVRKEGYVLESINYKGHPKSEPSIYLRNATNASETMRKYGAVLLLDPISRARIAVIKTNQRNKEEMDEMEMLIKGLK